MVRTALGLALLTLLLGACGSGAGTPPPAATGLDPTAFKSEVENAFFPLARGRVWVYEGDDEGRFCREEVRALDEPREILGIACTALHQTVTLDDEVVEVTTEWFAEDRDGNVWKFGEEALEFDGGTFFRTDDSWIAGEEGATLWMALAAEPRVGDVYVGYQPNGHEEVHVVSLAETVVVPAGAFEGCLQTDVNPDDIEDADVILYAGGTGKVSEQSSGGRVDLVGVQPPAR